MNLWIWSNKARVMLVVECNGLYGNAYMDSSGVFRCRANPWPLACLTTLHEPVAIRHGTTPSRAQARAMRICTGGIWHSYGDRLQHKTEDKIAAGMDWGAASASRFLFQRLLAALPTFPRLYRVLGNTIILQWLMDNTETGVQPVKPLDAPASTKSRRPVPADGRDRSRGQDVLANYRIDAAEARRDPPGTGAACRR